MEVKCENCDMEVKCENCISGSWYSRIIFSDQFMMLLALLFVIILSSQTGISIIVKSITLLIMGPPDLGSYFSNSTSSLSDLDSAGNGTAGETVLLQTLRRSAI